jgi:DNA-binding MarR family transcriptional regulator
MSRFCKRPGAAGRPNDQDAASAPRIVETLIATVHALQRFADARIAHCAAPGKLSGSRLRVLLAVAEAGSMRMGDLAAELGIAARTVTDLVDGLEREGLLVRRPDPTDRRATLLELSAVAQEHFESVRTTQHQMSEEILAPLDDAERRQLQDLLQRLRMGPIGEADGSALQGGA